MNDIDWSKVYRDSAKRMDTAGNIASGHGESGLANGCWALAARLREQARIAKVVTDQFDEAEKAGPQ